MITGRPSSGPCDGATTTWFSVATFNEGLQDWIQNNVYKGTHVAVQGTVTQKEGYGPDMLAVRVGLISWGQRSKLGERPQPVAANPRPVAATVDDDEDAF